MWRFPVDFDHCLAVVDDEEAGGVVVLPENILLLVFTVKHFFRDVVQFVFVHVPEDKVLVQVGCDQLNVICVRMLLRNIIVRHAACG